MNSMQISEKTKISELIKANPKSVQAIAALSKPLQKLKNPILRKIMASRVTIAEAAKMGGVPVLEFRRALEPLGFVFENARTEQQGGEDVPRPQWLENTDPNSMIFTMCDRLSTMVPILSKVFWDASKIPRLAVFCALSIALCPRRSFTYLNKKKQKMLMSKRSILQHFVLTS